MRGTPISTVWTVLLLVVISTGSGCASRGPAPEPGTEPGPPPDLRGRSVLVLPIQLLEGVPPGLTADAELAHALQSRGETVRWAFPPELERALARSPGLNARMYGLPVGSFLLAEVERVGDPLYGDVRRLTALVGSDIALIPVELRFLEEGAYRLTVALMNPTTGRVLWFGVVEGGSGGVDDPGTLASVADALARALLPLG